MDETPNAVGRPTKYTPEIATIICEQISAGETLPSIEKQINVSRINIWRWQDRYPEFRNAYARARVQQAEGFIDKIIDTARDCPSDLMEIQKARMKIDSYKFLAMKLAPRIYGDLVRAEAGLEQAVTNVGVQVNIQINQTVSPTAKIEQE